jgi:hypothetical protein
MNFRIPKKALASAAALIAVASLGTGAVHPGSAHAQPSPAEARAALAGWICDRADNICGLDDAKMLSSPAKVDFDALYKVTPEYKKIRDDKIDPNSSEGIHLRQKAHDRIRDAAESVRAQKGHCSVWKAVKHSDGRPIPDITEAVKAAL